MPSRTLDEYELRDQVGAGTVGAIYRAWDSKRELTLALKLLQEAVTSNDLVRQRFEREVLILRKLNHQNVIRYYDRGKHGKQLFYTMELIEGLTLRDILDRDGRLSWKQAIELGWQVASALQHAHNHGIVHRDLKPSNLYVSRDGSIRLGDFGIALDTGEASITDQGLTVGSWQYMAPEQIRGEDAVTGAADLYALGCLLFEIVTGQAPYRGQNFARIFDQHLNAAVPSVRDTIPDCPDRLDELIQRLLSKNPEDRPISAREVQNVLGEVLYEEAGIDPHSLRIQAEEVRRDLELLTEPRVEPERDVSWKQMMALLVVVIAIVAVAALAR